MQHLTPMTYNDIEPLGPTICAAKAFHRHCLTKGPHSTLQARCGIILGPHGPACHAWHNGEEH